MTEQQLRNRLPQYADGELSATEVAEVEAALREWPALQEELVQWRGLRCACERVHQAIDVPGDLASRVRTALADAEGVGDLTTPSPSRAMSTNPTANVPLRNPQPVIYRLFGGLTAVAAVVVAMFAIWWGPGVTPAVAETVSPMSFVDVYQLCAVEHGHSELSREELCLIKARQVAEGRIRACQLPDLSDVGFKLSGICFCSKIDGAKVVHAFYRRGNDVVSVFNVGNPVKIEGCSACCGVAPCGAQRTYDIATVGEVRLLSWRCASRTITVCSSLPEAELRSIAGHIATVPGDSRVARAGL